MKIVDAIVLPYAVDERAMHHRSADAWLRQALAAEEAIGLPGKRCWRSFE